MSKHKPPKKKVVVSTSKPEKKKVKPTVAKTRTTASKRPATPVQADLLFGRINYLLLLAAAGLIALGLVLMSGGGMPSPDVWDESIIYSHRRITLAPIVILLGLGVGVYAIFKPKTAKIEA
ncbi:MAG: DUF3098 domain-containing protein [Saprospiraceae bacterium]|nr:DUF3098 domain-containing protein [Saprospiraceae bacterium]